MQVDQGTEHTDKALYSKVLRNGCPQALMVVGGCRDDGH